METSIHNVTAISVSDTVHENQDRTDGGFAVRCISVTVLDDKGEKFTYKVKAFSNGTTPAKLSI